MNTYPKTKPAPAGYTGLSVEELERRERAAYAEGAEAMRAKLRHHAERSGLIMLPGLDAFLRDMPLPEMP